jgi:hypothetical protein
MKAWSEKKWFIRFLEIIPGLSAWLFILSPFVLAFIVPVWVAIFILVYCVYFLFKSANIGRHLVTGFWRLQRNVKTDWLLRLKKTENLSELESFLERIYREDKNRYNYEDWLYIKNLGKEQNLIKKWQDITHVVVIAVLNEDYEIVQPTVDAIIESDYPSEKIMVVIAAEERCKGETSEVIERLEKRYKHKLADFKYYYHKVAKGEVIGKGPNISYAGKHFWKDYEGKLIPEDVLVTNIDADHLVHKHYFSRLTYLYVIDPARSNKTYQPVPLLFNNIWDAAFFCRIQAVGSSFWQIIEAMRPFRLRTFAAHTQSLATLLVTDFWAINTIVEDGHQYWRTYFAFNGDCDMVPLFVPVYQDAVHGDTMWEAFVNQYKQRRRWAWGVSDFPFTVLNCIKHKEIPIFERLLQIFRQMAGNFSWSTSSFVLAFAWIPLFFNTTFQNMVFAHNLSIYTATILAWVGLVINIWISMILLPPRPKRYTRWKNLEMIAQWVFSPITAIVVSSLPALDSQTRLMIGKKLDKFWSVPKKRVSELTTLNEK